MFRAFWIFFGIVVVLLVAVWAVVAVIGVRLVEGVCKTFLNGC